MYVDGMCVINVFIYSWIQGPIFTSFVQQIRRPLCVHHDLLSAARVCLHLFQRLACIMERSVVVIWFLWGQKWIVAFFSSWNNSVCFDYNIQVLWLTSNRCWADVGGRHQPNVEATLGRHRTADIDPTSAQHMFPCSFFFSIICQNYFAPKSSQCWKQRSILVQSCTDLLYTNMKTWFILTHWGPDKMDAIFPDDIFKCIFLNANIWISTKFSLKFVCKGPIDNIYERWFR